MKFLSSFDSLRRASLMPGLRHLRYVLVVAVLGLASTAFAQSGTSGSEPVVGLIQPNAIAWQPVDGNIYTVNTERCEVSVVNDAAGTTAAIRVGAGPVSVAADTVRDRIYVANAGDGTVSVIDGKKGAVLATIPVGAHPYSIAVNSATGKVYISHTFSDVLTVLDGSRDAGIDHASNDQASKVKAGGVDLIAINEKAEKVYLLGYEGGDLKVLDSGDRQVASASPGMHAWGMALNPATGLVYVGRTGSAEVAVFDGGGQLVRRIPVGKIPSAVAVNAKTDTVYVANYEDGTVSVIDGRRGAVVATVPVGVRPEGIAVDAARDLVAVANTQSGTVTLIDGKMRKVLRTMPAGSHPYAVAFNPASGRLHVATLDAKAFTVLDPLR
jgi:YVTN family beta-propeller protein